MWGVSWGLGFSAGRASLQREQGQACSTRSEHAAARGVPTVGRSLHRGGPGKAGLGKGGDNCAPSTRFSCDRMETEGGG